MSSHLSNTREGVALAGLLLQLQLLRAHMLLKPVRKSKFQSNRSLIVLTVRAIEVANVKVDLFRRL